MPHRNNAPTFRLTLFQCVFWVSGIKSKKMKKSILLLLWVPLSSFAGHAPLALIWDGPGSCFPNCTSNAVAVAKQAGMTVKRIRPGFKDFSVFDRANVWIQPGGKSVTAAKSMGAPLLDKIRSFVSEGGAYVGFCAGMFLSTAKIGTSGKTGLGLVPGSTELLRGDAPWMILPVSITTGTRYMYYAGGPFITLSDQDIAQYQVKIIGRYEDGKIAAIESTYGKGRVAVSGFHPEQSKFWKWWRRVRDPDGSDRDFAVDMIRSTQTPATP